jgi:hypothetical protein
MKKILILLALPVCFGWVACSREKAKYIDLRTGETIKLEKDPVTGFWINADTKEAPYIYVDTKSGDTIYGKTGKVINGHVVRSNDNVYWYDADYDIEYKVKSGDYKKEVEKDGDVTIKDGDTKIKVDGKTGETKVKKD